MCTEEVVLEGRRSRRGQDGKERTIRAGQKTGETGKGKNYKIKVKGRKR